MEQEEKTQGSRSETLLHLAILAAIIAAAAVWWETFRTPVMFIVTLGILVMIHEWGHFIAAKAVGVRVYEFAVGMGPKLVTYMRRGGTDYTIRALPIGGFVNPKGMQPDDPVTPDGINGRRPAERALVYLAGPMMNVVLCVVIMLFSGFLFGGPDEHKVLVGEVLKHKPASMMTVTMANGEPATGYAPGLKTGDQVLAVNGHAITSPEELTDQIYPNAGKTVTVDVQRGNDQLTLIGMPQPGTISGTYLVVAGIPAKTTLALKPGDQLVNVDGIRATDPGAEKAIENDLREKSGQPITVRVWRNADHEVVVHGAAGPLDLKMEDGTRKVALLGFGPTFGQGPRLSLGRSVQSGVGMLLLMGQLYAQLFNPKHIRQLGESVGGPVAIWVMIGDIGRLPAFNYCGLLAQLSLSLAIFNLIPVPVLDGGHMLLLTVEVLRRRRLEPETHRAVALAGFAIVVALGLFVFYKDILRQWFG